MNIAESADMMYDTSIIRLDCRGSAACTQGKQPIKSMIASADPPDLVIFQDRVLLSIISYLCISLHASLSNDILMDEKKNPSNAIAGIPNSCNPAEN